MIKILELVNKAKKQGYDEANAEAKVCQDIILALISKCNFSNNITVKGGVVMRSISNNIRRATLDIDLDFIKYSLSEKSIHEFIQKLNSTDVVFIKIIDPIEELKQQDYHGKRVNIEISDKNKTTLKTKIDFGVHKQLDITQEEFCFDTGMDNDGVCLLINSKEQMITEKLRSILKFGSFSTRYKDIFDICYLLDYIVPAKLILCFEYYIYNDINMKENNIADITKRLNKIFNDPLYLSKLEKSKKNWLDQDVHAVLSKIIDVLGNL